MRKERRPSSPEQISAAIKAYLDLRAGQLAPEGDWSKSAGRFSWCGEVLAFLADGLEAYAAARGFTFRGGYPGPLRLWDEDQQPDGEHARRFWTTAVDRETGRPLASICTVFFHRHDRVALPRPPLVLAFEVASSVDEEPQA